jgi:hypothetical protein
MIDHSWVRGDIIDHDWSPPAQPADCELDHGGGIHITPDGESISAGVLRCASVDSGITRRDTNTGHGFSIARQAYQLF